MGIFTRKSTFDHLVDSAGAVVTSSAAKRAGRYGAGLVAGLVSLSAVSSAISSARQQENS